MAEFVEFHSVQERMEAGHAMVAAALLSQSDQVMNMIPRITVREESDLIHLLTAMMCAKESMVGTVSQAIAEYGLRGTEEAYNNLREKTENLGEVAGLAFNLQEMYDELLAKARAEALRENDPGN